MGSWKNDLHTSHKTDEEDCIVWIRKVRVSVLKTKGLLLSVSSLRKSPLKQFIQKQRTLNPRPHSSVETRGCADCFFSIVVQHIYNAWGTVGERGHRPRCRATVITATERQTDYVHLGYSAIPKDWPRKQEAETQTNVKKRKNKEEAQWARQQERDNSRNNEMGKKVTLISH